MIEAPIFEKQEIARISISLEGEQLLELPVSAQKAIDEASLFMRLWDAIEIWFRVSSKE